MAYVKVSEVGELKPGEKKRVTLPDKVLMLANVDGTYYALDNRCPHMGGSLSDGELSGETLACPRHGAKFDVRTGKSVGNAKLGFLSVKVNDAKSYPVKVVGADILTDLG